MSFSGAAFCVFVVLVSAGLVSNASAKGEPVEAFVKQLRNAGYFDTALSYLDRTKTMKGIDQSFIAAIPLEKAQTHIDAALNARNPKARDEAFTSAESSLKEFLKLGSHPRASEARLQLGKLQMIRAGQLMIGDVDQRKRSDARDSYLGAMKTFDAIVEQLRGKLKELQGQKIDAAADPDAANQRDQYRFEFLQSQVNAAEAIKLAAKTYVDPGKDGKANLEDAAKRFVELNQKYAKYPPGATALMHLGQIYELLGDDKQSLDNYLGMLELSEADPLRDAKFLAAAGLIRMKLKLKPPKYKDAISRTSSYAKDIRPNEASSPSVQEYRVELAKAYLAKSTDDTLKKGEIGRAKTEGRKLLREAGKVPGSHVEEVEQLLADLGIESEAAKLPTAEPPKSFDDAMEKSREILAVVGDLEKAREVIASQGESKEVKKQLAEVDQQITESYAIGVQVLRAGLTMVNSETDRESIDQARQILTYFLYQLKHNRETVVVGSFLARSTPGTEVGLKGGLMALTALQLLLGEVPEEENGGLIRQLESLGKYMSKTWPDNKQAAAAQGIQIRLLLKKDDFEAAKALIDKMPEGSERASFKRLLGQLLWNESIKALNEDKDQGKCDHLRNEAKLLLQQGLDELPGNLLEVEAVRAAAVLVKVHLALGNSGDALKTLDHPKYGPLEWTKKLDLPPDAFVGDLYSSELKALVGQMLLADDPGKYQDRMTQTMERLRQAFQGPDSKAALMLTYKVLARDLREQLDTAAPGKKGKLIDAFRVMLKRISDGTNDPATLRWGGQTLMSMGEALLQPGQMKAEGQSAELISQASETFEALAGKIQKGDGGNQGGDQNRADDITTLFLLGKAKRLVGEYKSAIDTFAKVLEMNPNMLDAQFEAAQAYESWAGTLKPTTAYKAYSAALKGSRPSGPKKVNVIWGWAEISQKTNKNPNFKAKFFESRYHVNLCLFLMGKALKRKSEVRKAIKDIRKIATLFPDMGGPEQRNRFDALMKECQKEVGEKPVGLGKLASG